MRGREKVEKFIRFPAPGASFGRLFCNVRRRFRVFNHESRIVSRREAGKPLREWARMTYLAVRMVSGEEV